MTTRPFLGAIVLALTCGAAALAQPAAAPAAATPAAAPDPEAATAAAIVQLYDTSVHPQISGKFAGLTIATTTGRSQLVWVGGSVGGPTDAPTRLFFSNVTKVTPPVDPKLLLRLLKDNNSELPYGYWAMADQPDGTEIISYQVEVRADAPASTVQKVMSTVATRADALEAELTPGKDVY